MTSDLTRRIHAALAQTLDGPPDADQLNAALRLLAKWRSALVANTLRKSQGERIAQGPFAGMIYDVAATEGGASARLLGCYEASLHPVIADIRRRAPTRIVDIGCAEGYYAVGLARLLSQTQIIARDTDPKAQAACAALAATNAVADRVVVGGAVSPADLQALCDPQTVIICDIEGAEGDLLDPTHAPRLAQVAILVETHGAAVLDRLQARFAPTHAITRLDRVATTDSLPEVAEAWSDLDRLLALWEWRSQPTPWLWMVPRGDAVADPSGRS